MKHVLITLATVAAFVLGFGLKIDAQSGSIGFSLIVQNGGVAKGAVVTLNCDGTTVTCSVSGGKVSLSGIAGGSGINQLTQDVTAGPGSGSQVATVVGTNGKLLPSSSTTICTNSSSQIVNTGCAVPSTATSITQGLFASLPATCAVSDLYFVTDSGYIGRCSATNVFSLFMNPWGLVVPPGGLSTMTWVNQGTATIDQTGGIAYINQAAGNSNAHNWALRNLTIPTPSSPFTITAVITVLSSSRIVSGNNRAGIAIRDSASGKFTDIDWNWAAQTFGHVDSLTWTNPTTFGGTTNFSTVWTGTGSTQNAQPFSIVLRIQTDSTNTTFYASNDGVHFVNLFAQTKNTFQTPDSVAFGISNFSTTLDMFVYSFKLTQP